MYFNGDTQRDQRISSILGFRAIIYLITSIVALLSRVLDFALCYLDLKQYNVDSLEHKDFKTLPYVGNNVEEDIIFSEKVQSDTNTDVNSISPSVFNRAFDKVIKRYRFGFIVGDKRRSRVSSVSFKSHGINPICINLSLVCIFGVCLTSVSAQCNSIPISLSNLTSCTGTTCLLTQTAFVSIPVFQGSSACIEFISPDGVSNIESFNISISHSFYRYRPSSIYWTDDPWIEGLGNCKCPPSSGYNRISCQNENLEVANTTSTVWLFGVNAGIGCPLNPVGLSATHCYKLGFNALKRFKILDFGTVPVKDIGLSLSFSDGNVTSDPWETEYIGLPVYEMSSDNNINVTVVSDTVSNYLDVQNVVFDVSDTSDFYILDDSDVNNLDTFDNGKIGWIKVDLPIKISPNIETQIPVDVANCLVDKFGSVSPFLSVEDKLLQNRHRLSEVIAPGSILYDPNYYFGTTKMTMKTAPDVNLKPWHYLQFGWLMSNQDGPVFVGYSQSGEWLPPTKICGQLPWLQNITTNVGPNRNLSSVTVCWGDLTFLLPMDTATFGYTYWMMKLITFANTTSGQTEYGICMFNNVAIGVDFTIIPLGSISIYLASSLGSCYAPNFNTTAWPTLQIGNFIFNGTFHQSYSGYTSDIASTSLVNPINEGVVNVLITFKDLEIQFQSNAIKPRIISVGTDNVNGIWVFSQSVTIGGVCYISTYPAGIFTTQAITLGLNPINNTYVFAPVAYNALISVVIRCAQSTSEMGVVVNYDLSPNQSRLMNITDKDKPIDWWFPNFDWPTIFPKVPGIDKAVTDWILLVVYWILYIVIIVLVLVLLYWLLKWLVCRFLKMKFVSRIPFLKRWYKTDKIKYL